MIARWLHLISHWRGGPNGIRIISLRLLLHMMGPLLLGCCKQGTHASHVGIHKSSLSKRAQHSSYSIGGLTAFSIYIYPGMVLWTYQHSSKLGFTLLKTTYPLVHIDPMWFGQLFVMSLCISVKPQWFATMQMNDGLCDINFMIPSGYLTYSILLGKKDFSCCEKILLTFKHLPI